MPLVITGNQNPLLKDSIASHDLKKINKSALKMILLEEIWLNDKSGLHIIIGFLWVTLSQVFPFQIILKKEISTYQW